MAHHPVIARALGLLGGAAALHLAAFALAAGPGSQAAVRLTGDLGSSGLYFTIYLLGAAVGAAAGGRAMDAWGRRRPLAAALALTSVGFAVAGAGVAASSLAVFVAGAALVALGSGTVQLTRVAAADMFPAARRGEGVAFILVAMTAGAIVGPLALLSSGSISAATGQEAAVVVWWLAAPLPLLGALLVARAPEPTAIARDLARYYPDLPPTPAAATGAALPRLPLAAGVAAVAVSYAAMMGVMGITGAALSHEGHGFEVVGATMALHFIGMYAFALRVGRIADRVGRRTTIAAGLLVLVGASSVLVAAPHSAGLALGLFLVGVGWCFAYLGGTVLLTDIVPVARRARLLGTVDFGAALFGGAISAAQGLVLAREGLVGVGLLAAALVMLPLVLASLLPAPRPAAEEPAPAPAGP